MEKTIEKTFMNSEVPKPLAKEARIIAAHLGISRSELVRLALIDYLKRLNAQNPTKETHHERITA